MKVTVVRYEKLVNLGNYENQKIGVEVALEDGDTPLDAVNRAKAFVESIIKPPDEYEIENAKRIVDNPDDFTPKKYRQAQEVLSRVVKSEVPF